jgi:predicted transglutaminase-like protease
LDGTELGFFPTLCISFCCSCCFLFLIGNLACYGWILSDWLEVFVVVDYKNIDRTYLQIIVTPFTREFGV